MIKDRWAYDTARPDCPGHDVPDAVALNEVLGKWPVRDGDQMPRQGHVAELRCDRARTGRHLLGRIFTTTKGPLVIVLYDSGRNTRRMPDGQVLRTLKYRQARAFLLLGDLVGSSARCDCTEVIFDQDVRRRLSAIARKGVRSVSLPSALCDGT